MNLYREEKAIDERIALRPREAAEMLGVSAKMFWSRTVPRGPIPCKRLGKLAKRAGVELWEKPWVNLRTSAATDVADKHPSHVCEAWLGHSEAIANRHYRQVTEEHYRKAVEKAAPNPAPTFVARGGNASSVATPRTQQAPVFSGKTEEYEGLPFGTGYCTLVPVPPRGVEPIAAK